MWNDVFNIAISNGVFAALFVALLVYVLKDSRKREVKYQNIIETLSTKLNTVEEIQKDVTEIKECITCTKIGRKHEKTNKVI
ncbi:MAG: bacteriocin [Clostridiales bacterium]|nr:bacteriocin [Clostridiales bacterium]